jgi:ADP-heptose:LPS heptosyltransferase
VDSLGDLDRFAAQVASMDAVVTISNTGAHVAGAVGVPTAIILDDKNHLIWPAWGERTGWYPTVRLVRRNARNWPDVLADAINTFRHELVR